MFFEEKCGIFHNLSTKPLLFYCFIHELPLFPQKFSKGLLENTCYRAFLLKFQKKYTVSDDYVTCLIHADFWYKANHRFRMKNIVPVYVSFVLWHKVLLRHFYNTNQVIPITAENTSKNFPLSIPRSVFYSPTLPDCPARYPFQ